jgi:hypothetical protein
MSVITSQVVSAGILCKLKRDYVKEMTLFSQTPYENIMELFQSGVWYFLKIATTCERTKVLSSI